MAKLSISEAARRAGVSRPNLYKRYIKPGLLTVEQDTQGNPQIDTSELLRVFGELKDGDSQNSPPLQQATPQTDPLIQVLRAENEHLKEQLRWTQQQVEKLTEQLSIFQRVLPPPRRQGLWARLFGKGD